MISREDREGSPRRSGSIVRSTGSISAGEALFGWRTTTTSRNEIGKSVRIGISKEADRVLRFYLRGSPFVSGARSLNA